MTKDKQPAIEIPDNPDQRVLARTRYEEAKKLEETEFKELVSALQSLHGKEWPPKLRRAFAGFDFVRRAKESTLSWMITTLRHGSAHLAMETCTLSQERNELEHLLTGLESGKDMFVKRGNFWIVKYQQGRLPPIKSTRGMEYTHYLLEHPGKPLSPKELIDAVQPELSLPDLSEERGVLEPEGGTKEQPTGNKGVTIRGKDMEDRPDVAADVAIRNAEKELQKALDNIDGEPGLTVDERDKEREKLKADLERFKEYRRKHRGTGKKPRQYHDKNRERQRQLVKINITRARDQFKKADPQLYDHLKAAIFQQEGLWAYKPSGKYIPEWLTQ